MSGDKRSGLTDETLREFWRRRATLSEPEWGELYTLVFHVLCYKCNELLSQLPGEREEYIQDFFEDKVMTLGNQGDEIHHSGALVIYYKRYLLSRLRDPYVKRRAISQGEEEGEEAVSNPLERALAARTFDAEGGVDADPSDLRHLTDWLAAEIGGFTPEADVASDAAEVSELVARYTGVELGKQAAAAMAFLHGRGDWEHLADDGWWVRLYLRCHFCAEPVDAVALNTLARKHQIPSYHLKAVVLGISVPKKTGAALESFRRSYRGQWLSRLGIPVDPDHLVEMSLALKVLCLVALKSYDSC